MKTRIIALLMAGMLVLCGPVDAKTGQKRGSATSCKNSYSTYSVPSSSYSKPPTYKVGTTTYVSGKYYKTGYPKVERSSSVRSQYLRQNGYSKVPQGYEVDHIVPLSRGGTDATYNMQLLPKSVHKAKTASER